MLGSHPVESQDNGDPTVAPRHEQIAQIQPDEHVTELKPFGGEVEDEKPRLNFRQVDRINISVRSLSVKAELKSSFTDSIKSGLRKHAKESSHKEQKTIIDNINAELPAGSITAILGASGSGKTTLLNVLSQRLASSRMHRSGQVLYGGNANLEEIRSAYVMQQDILLPTLTVRETLRYAAELRLPPPATSDERISIVEEIISELGLKECAKTRIGNNAHKGCSGGEKRRTSLGVQLLSNPSVLFVDEGTTGLDAASAFQLVQTLKQLAQRGRTIVMTIHQPRSEIWDLFDQVILLSGGCALYSGISSFCIDHFTTLGYPLPAFVNPAEHLIDLAAVDNRFPELESKSVERVQKLKDAWRSKCFSSLPESIITSQRRPARAGFVRQVRVQTQRAFKVACRDPMGVAGCLIESILMAIIAGLIFLNLDGSLSGIRSRQGAVYVAIALQNYLILLFETYRLTLEIGVYDRERAEGVVDAASFLVSRRAARALLEDIPAPFLFAIIFYFMVGFRLDAGQFFRFFGALLISHYSAVTFAMVAVALARDFAGASLVCNLNFTVQSLCCGFFVQSNQIPVYTRWLKYTAYVWYLNGALITNEFIGNSDSKFGQLYDCIYPGGVDNPQCAPWTGAFVVDSLGYPRTGWIWRPLLVAVAFVLGFLSISWMILTFAKVDMRTAQARKPKPDSSSIGLEEVSVVDRRPLGVTLQDFSLDIEKIDMLRRTHTIPIVRPVSTQFQPGILNVIMGVSGGGKTSLLNMMAQRLSSTPTTRYKIDGQMLFGGSIPSQDVVRSVTSYVCQSDEALLPNLTVRETLFFAAQLRLPTWMSNEDKKRRAESVLRKLGLRDCADSLVGNDQVKGISGGEKRRVSLAIQILTEPQILFLDEPTSGLDAFTASSILECLRGLAQEGRTIILTIHQPRSDVFKYFGSVLLLARGGHTIYSGQGSGMLPYFASNGYVCPQHVNPADFALDLVSVDLQSAEEETRSREKVHTLVTEWQNNASAKSTRMDNSGSVLSQPAELGSYRRKPTSFLRATALLTRRSAISFRRSPPAMMARTMQVISFGVVLALFFAPLKNDYPSVTSRIGLLQEVVAVYFIGMLQNVAVYPDEKTVFYNEFEEGAYGVEPFFTAYTLLELPFDLVTALIFSILVTLAIGLPRNGTVFGVIALNCFALVNIGESVGMMFNTLFDSTGFAVNLTSVILSIGLIMSGVLSTDLNVVLSAFNYLSPGKWAIASMAPYSLQGVKFTCEEYQKDVDGRCPIETGEDVLDLYNLRLSGKLSIIWLIVTVVVYRLLAYILLKFAKGGWRLNLRRPWKREKAKS